MKSFKSFLLSEAPMSPALKNNKQIQKAANALDRLSDEDAYQMLDAVYDAEIVPIAKDRLGKFQKVVKKFLNSSKFRKMPGKPTVLSQIKSLKSIKSKAVDRGKSLTSIGDIVRGAILFDTSEQAQKFVDEFRRKNSSQIADYEFKAKGQDKEFGYYGSHHMDLMIDGLVVELQVTTKKLWTYKAAAHDIYNNLRDTKTKTASKKRYDDLPDSLKKLLGYEPVGSDDEKEKALSKRLFSLGNQQRRVSEEAEIDSLDESVIQYLFDNPVFFEELAEDLEYIDIEELTG
jgi:hypothetical protein